MQGWRHHWPALLAHVFAIETAYAKVCTALLNAVCACRQWAMSFRGNQLLRKIALFQCGQLPNLDDAVPLPARSGI